MSGRVAVTDANGFIGRSLVRHLLDAGWEVRAIVRHRRRCAMPDGVELVAAQFVAAALVRAAAGTEVRGRLGFSARIGLLEGFASTAAWYARHGLLAKPP